jgi:hypothetical protein
MTASFARILINRDFPLSHTATIYLKEYTVKEGFFLTLLYTYSNILPRKTGGIRRWTQGRKRHW